jgi:Flp pilus assembly protein TadG
MTFVSIPSALRKPLARFATNQDGVSAVEFAMLLPLMLTLYLGGVEVSQAVSADRKTMLAAKTVGDLVSQYSCVKPTDATTIFAVANEVVYPFGSNNLSASVTSVSIDKDSKATVTFSRTASGQGPYANGATVTTDIPTQLLVPNTALVWAEATYTYTPTVGYVITGSLTLREKVFLRPRLSTTAVTYDNCPT